MGQMACCFFQSSNSVLQRVEKVYQPAPLQVRIDQTVDQVLLIVQHACSTNPAVPLSCSPFASALY
jgi:hypothetical protein